MTPEIRTAGRHLTRCLSYCCRGGGEADKCSSSCSRHLCAEAHVGLLTLVGVMIFSSLGRLELAVATVRVFPLSVRHCEFLLRLINHEIPQ